MKEKKKKLVAGMVQQPVVAIAWHEAASVIVKRSLLDGEKSFRPVILTDTVNVSGMARLSRSKALQDAFNYCNERKIRVTKVTGVRGERYITW